MISVKSEGHNSSGIADLSEAIEIARRHGIANAEGAISPEICHNFSSLLTLVVLGMTDRLPKMTGFTTKERVTVYSFYPPTRPEGVTSLLENVELRVLEAAGEALPGWNPSSSLFGSRMVTMRGEASFRKHTDVYEGLVVSSQVCVDGVKTMHAIVNGQQVDTPIHQGDITLFACDSFGDVSRVPHSFSFVGTAAITFLLGQDPTYTISGALPMLQENPDYAADIQAALEFHRRGLL